MRGFAPNGMAFFRDDAARRVYVNRGFVSGTNDNEQVFQAAGFPNAAAASKAGYQAIARPDLVGQADRNFSSNSFNVVTGPQAAFGFGDIVGAGVSILKRAIPGPVDDVLIDAIGRKLNKPSAPQIAPSFSPTGSGPCTFPAIRVGSQCVDPSAALPGGRPLTRPAGTGVPANQSVFGLYVEPVEELVQVSRCPPGTVLGKDDLCYDRSALPNNLRKYPKPARLPVTRSDMTAIRKAKSAEKRVAALAKTAGLKVKR